VLKTTFLCKNNVVTFFYGFCGLIETEEAASTVSLKPHTPLMGSHWSCQSRFDSLIETAEAAFAVSLRPLKQTISNDYLEFLGDFEAICETALARETGPLGMLIDEKTSGRKSRDTVPLIKSRCLTLYIRKFDTKTMVFLKTDKIKRCRNFQAFKWYQKMYTKLLWDYPFKRTVTEVGVAVIASGSFALPGRFQNVWENMKKNLGCLCFLAARCKGHAEKGVWGCGVRVPVGVHT
jgi:hypothetical protein